MSFFLLRHKKEIKDGRGAWTLYIIGDYEQIRNRLKINQKIKNLSTNTNSRTTMNYIQKQTMPNDNESSN